MKQSYSAEQRKKNGRLVLFKTRVVNYQPDTLDHSENIDDDYIISKQIADTTIFWINTHLSRCSDCKEDIEFKNNSLFLDYWNVNKIDSVFIDLNC